MTLTLTDLFCGAGGSSSGAVQVPGVSVRIAANHWDLAVAVHNLNHPREVAAGMAFPADYSWNVLNAKGRPPSNRDLVKMAGNAVTPPAARDLISAVAASLGYGTAA